MKRRNSKKKNLFIILFIDKAFPGIGEDENITVSSFINVIFLSFPFAILESAANGSPWLPVQSKHTFSGAILFASSLVINISLLKMSTYLENAILPVKHVKK